MILSFRVFGYEVWALTFDRDPQDAEEEAPPDDPPTGITSGSGHNFERDLYPPNPSGEEPWTENRFGFG